MKAQYYITIALSIGVVALLNLVAGEWFFRLDYTEDGQYTLSDATISILEDIEEPVHIKAYFTEDLPENITRARQDFKDLLIEYNSHADGNIVYEFINPNENEESKNKAMQEGIQPVMIDVRENDERTQKQAFFGAIVQYGEEKEIIPFIQPGGAMEYALTTSIKKVASTDKPVIGILTGHGELGKDRLIQVSSHLEMLYEVREFEIDSAGIPSFYKAIAMVRPTDTLNPAHLTALDNYLAQGGSVFLAYNPVNPDLQTSFVTKKDIGLNGWLAQKGINVDEALVTDANCGQITVTQQRGMFRMQNNINFPYFPIVTSFGDHSAVKGLEGVVMQFPCPMAYSGDTAIKFTALAMSSEKSGTQGLPTYLDIQKQWTAADFGAPDQVLAGVLEGKIVGDQPSRLVVVTDGDLADNGEQGQQRQVQADNVNLVANSIDWLSDDSGLIDLRTQGVNYRPLDEIEDGTKTFLKYGNFLAPILLVMLYGFIRFQRRKAIRLRRQAIQYN